MLRQKIALYKEEQVALSSGEFELDESYFGGLRKKTHASDRRKRGRGAENKVPVFGIKKRDDGTVYTHIIENASKVTLLPIVKRLLILRIPLSTQTNGMDMTDSCLTDTNTSELIIFKRAHVAKI